MRHAALLLSAAVASVVAARGAEPGRHLFILSGQSNMAGLNPDASFTPAVSAALGADRVIVVKDAQSGQPIRRWHKAWQAADGSRPDETGDLYDRLMGKVKTAIAGQSVATVTFVWMQGERDARERHGDVYAASLQGLLGQLRADLGREDVLFVVGRLSDFDLADARYPHWTRVREAQVAVAEADPRGAWVDTDDLNDKPAGPDGAVRNDLHYTAEGYRELGRRFAEKAVALVRRHGPAAGAAAPDGPRP